MGLNLFTMTLRALLVGQGHLYSTPVDSCPLSYTHLLFVLNLTTQIHCRAAEFGQILLALDTSRRLFGEFDAFQRLNLCSFRS